MPENEKALNLYQKLVEVRKEVIYIQKDSSGYNFKYANSTELLGKIRPKMDELGLLLVPTMETFELIPWKRGNVDTKIPQIQVKYTWINVDNPSETISTSLVFYEDKMTGCQGIGSLLTYAERYFLYKFFQIATDQDAPEEYYKKHNLSSIAEQNQPQSPPVPKQQPSPPPIQLPPPSNDSIEFCREVSQIIWRGIRSKIPSLQEKYSEGLPEYLFEQKQKNPTLNLLERYSQPCTDPDKFLERLHEWETKRAAEKATCSQQQ